MLNVAEISVIVSGAVALGVPTVNAWWSTRQTSRTLRAGRIDELRSVLDAAAVALLGFMESVPTEDDVDAGRPNVEQRMPVMKAALQKVWQQEARVAVRLGIEHEISLAYRAAHDSAGNYLVYYRARLRQPPGDTASLMDIAVAQAAANAHFFTVAAAKIGPDQT